MACRCGAVIRITSAPWAASVRPHTGPAITRVRSSTRTPESGRSASLGRARAGASPILLISITGRRATAWPCGCAAHSAGERIMAVASPASAAVVSSVSPCHFISAACTASRS